jgi:hypothetical protein
VSEPLLPEIVKSAVRVTELDAVAIEQPASEKLSVTEPESVTRPPAKVQFPKLRVRAPDEQVEKACPAHDAA